MCVIVSFLGKTKLRFREVKGLPQGHTAGGSQSLALYTPVPLAHLPTYSHDSPFSEVWSHQAGGLPPPAWLVGRRGGGEALGAAAPQR